jgi:hypothetical protein
MSKHYPVEQRERAVSMSAGRCIDSGARLKLPLTCGFRCVSRRFQRGAQFLAQPACRYLE